MSQARRAYKSKIKVKKQTKIKVKKQTKIKVKKQTKIKVKKQSKIKVKKQAKYCDLQVSQSVRGCEDSSALPRRCAEVARLVPSLSKCVLK